jgi:hypothetical protein
MFRVGDLLRMQIRHMLSDHKECYIPVGFVLELAHYYYGNSA